MISAFARAAQVLDDTAYLDAATRAADFVRTKLYDAEGHTSASYRDGPDRHRRFRGRLRLPHPGLARSLRGSFDSLAAAGRTIQATQDRYSWTEHGRLLQQHRQRPEHSASHERGQRQAEPAAAPSPRCNLFRLAQIRERGAARRAEENNRRLFHVA